MKHYQVVGLKNLDFEKLKTNLSFSIIKSNINSGVNPDLLISLATELHSCEILRHCHKF